MSLSFYTYECVTGCTVYYAAVTKDKSLNNFYSYCIIPEQMSRVSGNECKGEGLIPSDCASFYSSNDQSNCSPVNRPIAAGLPLSWPSVSPAFACKSCVITLSYDPILLNLYVFVTHRYISITLNFMWSVQLIKLCNTIKSTYVFRSYNYFKKTIIFF